MRDQVEFLVDGGDAAGDRRVRISDRQRRAVEPNSASKLLAELVAESQRQQRSEESDRPDQRHQPDANDLDRPGQVLAVDQDQQARVDEG
jgi:hypothetical protein